MPKLKRQFLLSEIETAYLRSQIDNGDNIRIKNALQRLCRHYRRGARVHHEQRRGIINSLLGTTHQPNIDEKVRRWVLNALARIGDQDSCIPAIKLLMRKHADEPQTIASGISAIYKLCQAHPAEVLKDLKVDVQLANLAALQHVRAKDLNLDGLPLNVDHASPDLLKLALIVVGLGRSPENLLNPRHSDAEMVRVLGRHDDPGVSQYSVWAITENDSLGVKDLGLSIKDIDEYPPNVRAWVLQLLAMEANDDEPYVEVIRHGCGDRSAEARRGLALGLKETFVDVFEPLVLDWVGAEGDAEVRQHLLEHIVRQAHRSTSYEQYASEIYETEPRGSVLRQCMEASAVRLPIYTSFKAIDAGSTGDLFPERTVIMGNQYNIGNVQGALVNVGDGAVTNYGDATLLVLSPQQIAAVQVELAKLEAAVRDSDIDDDKKKQALTHVAEAKRDPSPPKVEKIIEFIGHLGTLGEAGLALAPYARALGSALGLV